MKERVVLAVALFLPLCLHAQKAELSIGAGAVASPDANGHIFCGEAINCGLPPGAIGPLAFGPGFAFQADAAWRLADFKAAALYIELPFVIAPSRADGNPSLIGANNDIRSLYFTPSVQFKFLPGKTVSPFASAGGGLAHFSSQGVSTNTGAAQFGGGLDFKLPLPRLSMRGEVRDFVSGSFGSFTSRVQHIYVGAGVVFKF